MENRKAKRNAVVHTDRVGKVFIVLSHNTRKCLICEQVFTREASRHHAEMPCCPTKTTEYRNSFEGLIAI